MHTILYISDLAPAESASCVSAILKVARNANHEHHITGALVFDGAHFVQCIEGEKAAVRQLMDNILQDPRHAHVQVLADQPIAERRCAGWQMGYASCEDDDLYTRLNNAPPRQELDIFHQLLGQYEML